MKKKWVTLGIVPVKRGALKAGKRKRATLAIAPIEWEALEKRGERCGCSAKAALEGTVNMALAELVVEEARGG